MAKEKGMDGSVEINVSSVFEKDGKKLAYVSFRDGDRTAEGTIPDCLLTKNEGFTKEETEQLEAYMKQELKTLKEMASGVNVMKAFMK
jgi:hypothetical protein